MQLRKKNDFSEVEEADVGSQASSFFKSVHFYHIHSLEGTSPWLNIPGRSNILGSNTLEEIILETVAMYSLGMSCSVSLKEEMKYYE